MKIWKDAYGDDADGNRGVMETFYDFEDTEEEREQIAELLYEDFLQGKVYGYTEIEWNDELIIDVCIEEYHTELLELLNEDSELDIKEKIEIKAEVVKDG